MIVDAGSVADTYREMFHKLAHVVPEPELSIKAEQAHLINKLKRERGAVILGHNYMEPALYHSVCDYTGDSLELSRIAATIKADPIVFCGVRFMAETAKILNPGRTVLLPARRAGCSLAASITADDVRELRRRYPGVPVVTYVNTYAEVKAESDICCTSSNAARVVDSLEAEQVIFIPDEYLARNVAATTSKEIVFPSAQPVSRERRKAESRNGLRYEIMGWHGRCEVHEKFTVADIRDVRSQFPGVVVLAHPECSPEVVAASDFSGSTGEMTHYIAETDAPRYLLLTECSMGDNIAAEAHDKEMVRLCSVRCPHMNEITLEEVLASLREDRYRIEVEASVREPARRAIERMFEVS